MAARKEGKKEAKKPSVSKGAPKSRQINNQQRVLSATQKELEKKITELKKLQDLDEYKKAELAALEEKWDNMDVDAPGDASTETLNQPVVKQEDGHLFVPNTGASDHGSAGDPTSATQTLGVPPTIVTSDSDGALQRVVHEDPEDLLNTDDMSNILSSGNNDGDGNHIQPFGWTKAGLGHKYVAIQYGPQNTARFRLKPANEVSTTITHDKNKNLAKSRPGEMKQDGELVIRPGHKITMQGVAWDYPNNHECPIQLLNPANWPMKVRRKKSPLTLIKVKLEHNGEILRGWETRSSIRRICGNKLITLPRDLKIGEQVVVSRTQEIGLADAMIIVSAIFGEERYQEWRRGERESLDRSPSPNPAVEKLQDTPSSPGPAVEEEEI